MNNKYIDLNLTESILHNINTGRYGDAEPVEVKDIPSIDGSSVIDRANLSSWSCDLNEACDNLRRFNPELREYMLGTEYGTTVDGPSGNQLRLSKEELGRIGVQLYPYVSFGILNGGSASSYADSRKNEALNPDLMKLYSRLFEKSSAAAAGKPKGTTPAYTNSDGTPGPDFIELKLRALLIENLRYRNTVNEHNELFRGDSSARQEDALYPMFQMTSVNTDDAISRAMDQYGDSPVIAPLIAETGTDITKILTGVQPMLAALTHSSVGKPKQIFTNAWGRDGEMLPMPGGHGQNFYILSEIYKYLYEKCGKRLVYISNVDNIGNMPDPVSIALTALSGCDASFEFSFRTPVDLKGGILIRDQFDRLNCADIGPAVSSEEVDRQEAAGRKILFNCATGLFKLEYLVENAELIPMKLPMRITDQNKDAGLYSQAEQVTWEIIGMLDKPLILGVNKYERFLAAKLLLESFMTSGLLLEDEDYPSHEEPSRNLKLTAENLYRGLCTNLEQVYGMQAVDGVWKPLPVGELKRRIYD